MAARFPELHRVLSPQGGLFLHVDDTMSHYLKILLDHVFGPANFAGQITWKRTSAHTTKGLGRVATRSSSSAAAARPRGADRTG